VDLSLFWNLEQYNPGALSYKKTPENRLGCMDGWALDLLLSICIFRDENEMKIAIYPSSILISVLLECFYG
jgi:hypothetical protein